MDSNFNIKIKEKLNVEERLDKLEDMIVHLHLHIEGIAAGLDEHEKMLMSLFPEDEWNRIEDDIYDFKGEIEGYTPINEDDKLKYYERLKKYKML